MAIRVFLAEASEVLRENLTKKLESNGYDVLAAENGEEGIHLLNVNNVPRVIITATDLPVKDGLTMTAEIKKDSRLKNIPIVVIKDSKTDEKSFRELGVEEFLPQPMQMPDLFSTIDILSKYGSRANIPQKKSGPGSGTLMAVLVLIAVLFVAVMIIGIDNIPFLRK